MEISEIRNQIAQNTEKMASFRDNLDLDRLEEEIALLDHDMSAPSFWDDNIAAQKIVEQSNQLKAQGSYRGSITSTHLLNVRSL